MPSEKGKRAEQQRKRRQSAAAETRHHSRPAGRGPDGHTWNDASGVWSDAAGRQPGTAERKKEQRQRKSQLQRQQRASAALLTSVAALVADGSGAAIEADFMQTVCGERSGLSFG